MCAEDVLAQKIVRLIMEHAIDDDGDINEEHAVNLVNAVIGEYVPCQGEMSSLDSYARFAEPGFDPHTPLQK